MKRATDRDFEMFGVDFKNLQSVALSKTVSKSIADLEREIEKTVGKVFWYPGNPSRLARREFTGKGAKTFSAKLTYRFEAVSLSKYPMKQIRITVGRKRLLVTRGGGAGSKFKSTPTDEQATVTQFKLRKSDGWRTVQGRTGYKFKGFLHTGTKGRFSSAVFERSQQATWQGKQRLPIHKLYGASLTWILQTPEIQSLLTSTKIFDKFEKDLFKSLTLRNN
jgi:hypothetical protein